MKTSLSSLSSARTLLAQLIEAPDLVQTIREMTPPAFSALVRHVGVADAGELVALGTTEQLVSAFDEDLFANARAGERETFQTARFVAWLEVLLDGGEANAARRFAELSEDFVARALSSIVLVLDYDQLASRVEEGDADARAADKALESHLSEEIDGYLLVSRGDDGWDAALALVLALDRDHRPYLVRVLARCAELTDSYVAESDGLASVLSAADELAEDVEAEREDRRSKLGYVDPRAARSFLALARTPLAGGAATAERDPITRAYFREVEPTPLTHRSAPGAWLPRVPDDSRSPLALAPAPTSLARREGDDDAPLVSAMRLLGAEYPVVYGERLQSLAYLANVLLEGVDDGGRRMAPREAAEAVLATVELGAELEAKQQPSGMRRRATPSELLEVLRECQLDVLFRMASSALAANETEVRVSGFLRCPSEVDGALRRLTRRHRERR